MKNTKKLAENITFNLGTGLLFVLPFAILEFFTSNGFENGFPWAVFIPLWIEGSLISAISISLFAELKNAKFPKNTSFYLRIILLLFVSMMYAYFVYDQWPCFWGGNGC
jgi:hypothetical protein